MPTVNQAKMNSFFKYLNTVRNNREKYEPTKHRRSLGGAQTYGSGATYKKRTISNRVKTAIKKLKKHASRK